MSRVLSQTQLSREVLRPVKKRKKLGHFLLPRLRVPAASRVLTLHSPITIIIIIIIIIIIFSSPLYRSSGDLPVTRHLPHQTYSVTGNPPNKTPSRTFYGDAWQLLVLLSDRHFS